MAKNYSSFSSIAKTRFKNMAKELGYEQITGTCYIKHHDGWFEGFGLQASQWGNDFFYINYGVGVPNVWNPLEPESKIDYGCEGYWLGFRLLNDTGETYPNSTKDEVKQSAELALKLYQEQAVPWFSEIKGMEDIAERYFFARKLTKEDLTNHSCTDGLGAANYGLFLFKLGKLNESLNWLKEAERVYSLPVYFTRDGRVVHEREKYARIAKLDDYEIKQLKTIKQVIAHIENILTDAHD